MKNVLTFKDKLLLSPLWLITLLPLSMLYVVSDFLFIILYYLIGYRKKTVTENLSRSFPDLSNREIRSLRSRFFRYLTDYFIESIYIIHMSREEVDRRYKLVNPELLQKLYAEGKDLMLVTDHYGNWEWSINFKEHAGGFDFLAIYKPLSNKTFDRLFIALRSKYGCDPIDMKHILRDVVSRRREGRRFLILNLADQRPVREDTHYWMKFLNQDTPVITGWERIARKFDLAVVYCDVERLKRGYYQITFRTLAENTGEYEQFAIVNKYMKSVERQVMRNPAYYLWSHKRWKFRREDFQPTHQSQ